MEEAKGFVITQVEYYRIIELQDGKDADELWLYIRKYEDATIKYAFTNAPADIEICELHHASTLRWPIEQSFQECKSFLGMGHYETLLSWMASTYVAGNGGTSFRGGGSVSVSKKTNQL